MYVIDILIKFYIYFYYYIMYIFLHLVKTRPLKMHLTFVKKIFTEKLLLNFIMYTLYVIYLLTTVKKIRIKETVLFLKNINFKNQF